MPLQCSTVSHSRQRGSGRTSELQGQAYQEGISSENHLLLTVSLWNVRTVILWLNFFAVPAGYMTQFVLLWRYLLLLPLLLLGGKKNNIHLKSTPGPFFRMKIVFHLQQITPPSPHSLATGPSFRDRPMEVKSAPTRYMRRESVNHFLYVRCLGKSNISFFSFQFHSKQKSCFFFKYSSCT